MRAFLAIDLEENARRAAARAGAALAREDAAWRGVPESRIHLTVAFLGEIDREQEFFLTTQLPNALLSLAAFSLALGGGGYFPSETQSPLDERNATVSRSPSRPRSRDRRAQLPGPSMPRVAWVGIQEGGDGARGVAARVAKACKDAGIALEERPFEAHVTVARRRPRCRPSIDALVRWREALRRGPLGPPFRVEGVSLYESILAADAPLYRLRARVPLGGATA